VEKGTYWLVGLQGNARKVRLPISGPILIGRGAYNHVVLKDARISRQHARIAPEADGNVLYDLNSTNGSFVNGTPVARRVLELGDELVFGPFPFRIEVGDGVPAPAHATHEEREAARELESPTLRDLGSVSRMAASVSALPASSSRDSSRESSSSMPVVDHGQLEDAYEKLGTLYSFMQAISKTIDRHELLSLICEQIGAVYPGASGVAIYLVARDAPGGFRLAHAVGSARPAEAGALPPEVAAALAEAPSSVLGAPAGGTTSMYALMVDRGETLGVIHVGADPRYGGFSRADLDLLNGMAAPAAMMLQNAAMHQEALQRDRLAYDLELAAQIQKSFLPREVVSVEGVELFAEYRAAYSVGGDFYDVFWVEPDRLGVFIGDIAGKGVSGALLMARISSELRVAALAHVDPVAVLATMNKALLGRHQPELFFTAIYLTIDVRTGEVVLANAGHPTPYWCHADGTIEPVTAGAAGPVGILDDPQFESTALRLGHGDSLVLYTDGVIEAADAQGGLYGNERLETCLAFAGTLPADIAEHILHSVQQHAADTPASDDLTLFICHRNVGSRPSLQPRRRSGTITAPTTASS
jgi:serine phosphatase RsbU (regulator of sigma subunit)